MSRHPHPTRTAKSNENFPWIIFIIGKDIQHYQQQPAELWRLLPYAAATSAMQTATSSAYHIHFYKICQSHISRRIVPPRLTTLTPSHYPIAHKIENHCHNHPKNNTDRPGQVYPAFISPASHRPEPAKSYPKPDHTYGILTKIQPTTGPQPKPHPHKFHPNRLLNISPLYTGHCKRYRPSKG